MAPLFNLVKIKLKIKEVNIDFNISCMELGKRKVNVFITVDAIAAAPDVTRPSTVGLLTVNDRL